MKREQKKTEKRAAILEAAHAEFTARRFDEVKLDDVAARAGVGKGTLYLYFTCKEDLFVQMAVDGVAEMADRIREIAGMDDSFHDRFFRFGREVGVFIEKRSVMFRLMHQISSETVRQQFLSHHKQLVKSARALIRKGVEEGVLRNDFSVTDLHCLLIGPLLFRNRLNESNKDRIEVEPLLQFFWEGASMT
jgi:AcrR family transcriptional regulator